MAKENLAAWDMLEGLKPDRPLAWRVNLMEATTLMVKVNMDGAAKGNPGQVGPGRIGRCCMELGDYDVSG